MIHRFDRALHWLTPLMVSAVLIVSLLLLVVTQRELQAQAERAEERTERLVDLLVEGRDVWGPALERIESRLADLE